MEINNRIAEIIDHLGLDHQTFAKSIGVAKSTISGIITNKRNPGAKVVYSILVTYKQVSADWLIRGDGNMLVQKKEPVELSIHKVNEKIDNLESSLKEFKKEVKKLDDKK